MQIKSCHSTHHTWAKQSGSGTVTFNDPDELNPTLTFDTAGSYDLQFMVSDGGLFTSDTVTITVYNAGNENQVPVIGAGQNQTITFPGAAGSGYMAPANVHLGFDDITSTYPNLRGLMTWSANWNASNNYEFANNHGLYLKRLGPIP